jgi:hypothetical protein
VASVVEAAAADDDAGSMMTERMGAISSRTIACTSALVAIVDLMSAMSSASAVKCLSAEAYIWIVFKISPPRLPE